MSDIELNEYTLKINEKIEDVKKLEAEKYMKLKKEKDGIDINFDDAYEEINKYSLDKIVNNYKEKWKLYTNYDAIQKLFSEDENEDIIKYYGLVYTIEDAIKIANDNNESFFVWYHNSYELNNYSSKLFFINIYNIGEDLMNKDNWVSHENVTTGLIKFEKEYFDNTLETNSNEDRLIELQNQLNLKNSENNQLKNNYYNMIDKSLNYKDLNNNIIADLDSKITTVGQSISMHNYETNINNNILTVLIIIFGLLCGIFIILMIYYNNKTAGKIKLFSFT
jgi:hypothetical protein